MMLGLLAAAPRCASLPVAAIVATAAVLVRSVLRDRLTMSSFLGDGGPAADPKRRRIL
jgi:hypothetical protein